MNVEKNVIILLISLLFLHCKNDKVLENSVSDFKDTYVEDSREQVFDVSAERVARRTYILNGELDNASLKEALISKLTEEGFKIQDSIRILPFGVPENYALVELSVTTLREGPSHISSMLSQALMGTPVKVLKKDGGWTYVQTPDNYLGWCEAGSLHYMDEDEWDEWKTARRIMVTKRSTVVKNLEKNNVVRDLVAGNILVVKEETSEGVVVETPDGKIGVVDADQVVPFEGSVFKLPVDVDDVKADALDLLGTPYLWGGTSVRALDCSGFTKTVYQLQGVILARDASLQVRHGKKVAVNGGWQSFETGDLLFFSPRPDSERITHVGIYLGNSEFIHEAGRVRINSLDSTKTHFSKYRARTLKQIRRVSGMEGAEGIVPMLKHPWYVN
jgi:uncharacterized protein YgiM (DUF1202 family)